MGEVGGNRKEEGRRIDKNSSIASDGNGDQGDARGDTGRSRSEGAGGSLFESSSTESSVSLSLSKASEQGDAKRKALIAWGRCKIEGG